LAEAQPEAALIALAAARELAATGHSQQAATLYERVASGAEFAIAGRAGLCGVLLTEGRYADLLQTLARLTSPQSVGAEAYRLLEAAGGAPCAPGPAAVDLPHP
jgi:hypothetical protein